MEALALFFEQRPNNSEFAVNLGDQLFDTAQQRFFGSLLKLMAQLGETDGSKKKTSAKH